MNRPQASSFPNIALSHFEFFVDDVTGMEDFYTRYLGFVVTDRGKGQDAMVFLSRSPTEHHQLVLNPKNPNTGTDSPVDHISFRVDTLAGLRVFHQSLVSNSISIQTVSHGTSWSVYFHDPEGNRLELFTDTPWHVDQPCRFEVDFSMSNEELLEFTELNIRDLSGFVAMSSWRESHYKKMMTVTSA